jgi:hypothetical protein
VAAAGVREVRHDGRSPAAQGGHRFPVEIRIGLLGAAGGRRLALSMAREII